ncbi:unnamed protein product [Angiostrongylus costaricensis]|uniref:Uncharacterized protein n=1 Tax=Angiostrongylus costaricensis TaxID=334426 RepID=A0A0R3PLJ2_ANGCS|nr:unnamed protein product [Angiostrongylus costaricensis]
MCFQQCFYCGGSTERCLPYAWYFPGCELNDVRHNKCWGKSIKNHLTINKDLLILCRLFKDVIRILVILYCKNTAYNQVYSV